MRSAQIRKAIFVDAASLRVMGNKFGIKKVDYIKLYKVLRQNVGTSSKHVRGPAVVSIPANYDPDNCGKPLVHAIKRAGFITVFGENRPQGDDWALIQEIEKYPVSHGDEIILVSCDYDFVNVLRKKRARGARVIIVGTIGKIAKGQRVGTVCIGGALQQLIESGEFSFVEFGNIAPTVCRELLHERETLIASPNTGFSVKLSCNQLMWKPTIMSELKNLSDRFPGLSFVEE